MKNIIAAAILGGSLVITGLICSISFREYRYELTTTTGGIEILDKKTGSVFTSNGRNLKEISISDKRIREYNILYGTEIE